MSRKSNLNKQSTLGHKAWGSAAATVLGLLHVSCCSATLCRPRELWSADLEKEREPGRETQEGRGQVKDR